MGCGQSAQERGEARNTFEEATTVFGDSNSITVGDPDHSTVEKREMTIGVSHRANILVVVHTVRDDTIRVIGARRANRKERKHYAENI
jgi:uncharacterized DUF497 family protein